MFRIYDSAVGAKTDVPLDPGESFKIYICGPTVYGPPHIGHGRNVLTFDILRRYLEWKGVEVVHVSNITDVDDKILDRAEETGEDPMALAARFEEEWWSTMTALGALRPHHTPHATAWVPQMIDFIQELMESDVAYLVEDGVYLDVSKVPDYGLLARQDLEMLVAGARVAEKGFKRSQADFALWKLDASDRLGWDSPFGRGRPGWHTECVVMSLGLLGEGFGLHGGGLDLRFPHHENERAQAVAAGREFALFWMHHGFVEVGGEKMSKSLNNFTTLAEMLEQHDPRAYRLLVLRSHYRSPVEVTPELAEDAENTLRRIDNLFVRLSEHEERASRIFADSDTIRRFSEAMDDDLDTPSAMAVVFDAITKANTLFDQREPDAAVGFGLAVSELLGAVGITPIERGDAPSSVVALADRRAEAKSARDYVEADRLRAEIASLGYEVRDGADGYRLSRLGSD